MLTIKIPNLCQSEQRYALDILLGEFLGLVFEVETYAGDVIEITRPGDFDDGASSSAKLTLDASFFHQAHQAWLKPESMPVLPLATWTPADDGINANLVEPSVPVLFGQPGLVKNGEHLHLNLDILGSAFFMLSRYEELITKDRDNHDRFPATASVAYKVGFLDRPIVNEYLEILWQCLHQLWPDLKRKEREFRKLISCDVDHPFDLVGYSLKRTILRVGARLIRDKNPKLAIFDGLNYVFKKFGSDTFDEYRNNIDWMMKVNDKAGNKVAFYFIPLQTDKNREDPNDIRSEKISTLLKHIVDSGHEIGIHPGYKTYKFPNNFKESAKILKEACKNKGIDTSNLGGRQHYLRYDVSQTPQLWRDNGFPYDSSLGYADKAGFRCGVCYEYTMYDLMSRQKLQHKQRPLIVMECTIIGQAYEGLGYSQSSMQRFGYFKGICQKFNGDYALLWHNSYLTFKCAKSHYVKAL
ncbi:MAG: polysaccharide deacetylase family protein [Methyloprofundus sp.]|nr:polysaccharide deacetylase family protein [Methyloprofundus sp.]